MLMFRFWNSDPRGSEQIQTVHIDQPMFNLGKPVVHSLVSGTTVTTTTTSPRPAKRRTPSSSTITSQAAATSLAAPKRPRIEEGSDEGSPRKKVALAGLGVEACRTEIEIEAENVCNTEGMDKEAAQPSSKTAQLERAREVIEHEFSHAILLKHQELRLINQEMAKCQVALEQLRRCHLIPYPVNVPTPQQMLNVTNGQGPALQSSAGARVPQWAPPFGVTDGPYARHYAKWLIPDPKFDGMLPEFSAHPESSRARHSVDGRSTRNNSTDLGGIPAKSRPGRGSVGSKLHSLSNGYPQPKDKAGPCILKRADGKTVKLVCIRCHRDNFSSTQGFINHCRIAHKLEYKSHEEAAVACGHPIDDEQAATVAAAAAAAAPVVVEEKPIVVSTPSSAGPVHPFALAESEACFSVVARIKESLDMYRKGQLTGVTSIPGVPRASAAAKAAPKPAPGFTPAADSPNLSRLLQSRGKSMDLSELVRDAKTKIDLNDVSYFVEDEETEDAETETAPSVVAPAEQAPSLVPRMRVPARSTMSPVPVPALPISACAMSSKGRTPPMAYATPIPSPGPRVIHHEPELVMDDEMDLDLSPNTAISNNAPSLVSDDGEYDDSVDGSSDESEVNDNLDAESVSDVAEITFDDDHVGPRSIRHHRGSSGAGTEAVRLREDDSKHVTFVSPVKDAGNHHRGGRRVN